MTWDGHHSYDELAEELQKLQAPFNEGRGVACVRGIVTMLRAYDWRSASAIVHNEWDKIRSYPTIVEWLEKYKLTELRNNLMK